MSFGFLARQPARSRWNAPVDLASPAGYTFGRRSPGWARRDRAGHHSG